jgi:hypothetical protein
MTPRSMARARGIGTLIGNGWLRESPRDVISPKWDMRGKSALRKCMFMAVPEQLRGMFPKVSASALPPPPAYRPDLAGDMVPHRSDPRKNARELPAFIPAASIPSPLVDPRVLAQQAHAQHVQDARKAAVAAASKPAAVWWEDPVALGSLLILLPPVGLAAVWSSKRYSSDARWALTVMTALTMCLMTAVIIAALAMS